MTPSLMLFFSLCAAVCFLLAWVVILPWTKVNAPNDNRLMQVNVDNFHARLAELEEDKMAGLIDETMYQAQVIDLQRQLLAAQTIYDAYPPTSLKSRLIVLLWIPLLAGLAYLVSGDRTPVFLLWQAQDSLGQVADELMTGKIDTPPAWATADSSALISAMQINVHRHANDADRWMRLSELFLSLDAKPQALEALARAYRLDVDNDEIASTYAQISFFANDGRLDNNARQVLTNLLANNPKHEGAQMLMAMGEARAGNYEQALAWVARLRSAIAAKSGNHSSALGSLDEMRATIESQAQKAALGVAVTVVIAPNLLPKVDANDVLFVSISDSQGGAPYAVQRLAVTAIKEGQVVLNLSDANAMLPERTLQVARQNNVSLVVSARISKTGNAISQSGDLSANPVVLASTANQAEILINQVVP